MGLLFGATATSSSRSSKSSTTEKELFKAARTGGRISSSAKQLSSPSNKIAPEVLADTEDGKSSSTVIFLADQADVSAANQMTDQDARGWYVYKTLSEHASRTQASLKSYLKSRGVEFQSFWIANMMVATIDRELVEVLASRPDIARLDSNRSARWIEEPEIAKAAAAPTAVNAIEWGVSNVNAPAVWALGFTGTNMVIGDLDTGTRWTHNALKPKYRGWNGVTADHNFNWWDSIHSGGGSCGPNTVAPCDDQGHGTHTAGTTVGDDGAGNQIGVAPGAKWIGCRNMNQGNGTPATYTECFQFAIAPTDLTGANPNPSLRPHVLNNSWGCPVSEGCTTRAELETIVNNVQAAGIFVVVSAGNSGPGCSTASDPPTIYNASFSVGAIDITNVLASFSSRGPSTFYTPNILKPQISAPGVTVRSSTRTSDSTFGNLSGTSMASPHVAGVVALLWSARPMLLRNIAATKTILQNTANPGVSVTPQTCGGTPSTQIPNNSFGYGRIDALAAVNASPTAATAKISGTIVDPNGQPVAGTTVTVQGTSRLVRAITNRDGHYVVEGLETNDLYTVTPTRANYTFSPQQRSFSLMADRTDAMFTGSSIGTDDSNPLESPEFFVRQNYLDFLGREPEQAGLDFWSGQLRSCGNDVECIRQRRIDVSAEFFISQEFSDSGLFLYDMYEGAFGRRPAYTEYSADRRLVVGGPHLEQDKAAFSAAFVERSEFTTLYPLSMSAEVYVDALLQRAGQVSGLDLSGERGRLLQLYQTGSSVTESRSFVLRSVVEAEAFKQTQYNAGFVLSEYFSYLGRNPDQAGYNFWLNVLNNGDRNNYRGMVCSFLTSTEYQRRFATVIPRSNVECR
jgi:serine protease AprX